MNSYELLIVPYNSYEFLIGKMSFWVRAPMPFRMPAEGAPGLLADAFFAIPRDSQ